MTDLLTPAELAAIRARAEELRQLFAEYDDLPPGYICDWASWCEFFGEPGKPLAQTDVPALLAHVDALTALCQTVTNHVTRATLNVNLQSTSRPRSSIYRGDLDAAWIALYDAGFRGEGSLDPLVTPEAELRDELGRKEDRIAELTALVREMLDAGEMLIPPSSHVWCAFCEGRDGEHMPDCPVTRAQALGEG